MPHPLAIMALERQATNAREDVPETVAFIATEHDQTRPVELAKQRLLIETEAGVGQLLVDASATLDETPLPGVQEARIVVHGCLRNAGDYYRALVKAMKHAHAPLDNSSIKPPLIVAPQFAAPVDTQEPSTLRWAYSGWRGGEPAVAPCAPISSFDAMDEIVDHLVLKLPDLRSLRLYGNSEGGQFLDRYLAFGRALARAETDGVAVEGLASNPGTVLYFDNFRPIFDEQDRISGSVEISTDSPANRWPFGMEDPPPYIVDYLQEYNLGKAIMDYLRRMTLVVGGLDNNPQASQLPIGPGPDEQGSTRYQRAQGKAMHVRHFAAVLGEMTSFEGRLSVLEATGHDAGAVFLLNELRAATADANEFVH